MKNKNSVRLMMFILFPLLFAGLNGCTLSSSESNPIGGIAGLNVTPSVTGASLSSNGLTLNGSKFDSVASFSLGQGALVIPFGAFTRSAAQLTGLATQNATIARAQQASLYTANSNLQTLSTGVLTINLSGMPISNFQSTGITDSATGTAMTINSSGDVGIGATSPQVAEAKKEKMARDKEIAELKLRLSSVEKSLLRNSSRKE